MYVNAKLDMYYLRSGIMPVRTCVQKQTRSVTRILPLTPEPILSSRTKYRKDEASVIGWARTNRWRLG